MPSPRDDCGILWFSSPSYPNYRDAGCGICRNGCLDPPGNSHISAFSSATRQMSVEWTGKLDSTSLPGDQGSLSRQSLPGPSSHYIYVPHSEGEFYWYWEDKYICLHDPDRLTMVRVSIRVCKQVSDIGRVGWIQPVKYVKLAPAHQSQYQGVIDSDMVHGSPVRGGKPSFFQIFTCDPEIFRATLFLIRSPFNPK